MTSSNKPSGKRISKGNGAARIAPARKSARAGAGAAALEGGPAPAFELSDGAGHKTSLSAMTARANVVLYFYPKDMTPGCTAEACAFRDLAGEMRALGAVVVGISADPPASHEKFSTKYGLDFPLLSDPDHRVAKAYGVFQKKSLYGRQFMGIVRTTFVIDRKGTVRRVFPKVRVDGHAREVLSALADLG